MKVMEKSEKSKNKKDLAKLEGFGLRSHPSYHSKGLTADS